MLGVYITAWSRLPIEEVLIWIAVTYATSIVYEVVRRWQSSGKPIRHAFLGRPAAEELSAGRPPQSNSPHRRRTAEIDNANHL